MSAVSLLRSRSAAAHGVVDAAFGGYDLHDIADYRRFLIAHARALPLAEAQAAAVWPMLRRRTPLLAADLSAMGTPTDLAEMTDEHAGPEEFGALYVVEGSRLGGGLLAGRVGAGLPNAYLSATHEPGEWRAIRAAIDAAAEGQNAAWHEALVEGALATFRLYDPSA